MFLQASEGVDESLCGIDRDSDRSPLWSSPQHPYNPLVSHESRKSENMECTIATLRHQSAAFVAMQGVPSGLPIWLFTRCKILPGINSSTILESCICSSTPLCARYGGFARQRSKMSREAISKTYAK